MGWTPNTREYLPQNIICFGVPATQQRQPKVSAARRWNRHSALFDQCAVKSNNLLQVIEKNISFRPAIEGLLPGKGEVDGDRYAFNPDP